VNERRALLPGGFEEVRANEKSSSKHDFRPEYRCRLWRNELSERSISQVKNYFHCSNWPACVIHCSEHTVLPRESFCCSRKKRIIVLRLSQYLIHLPVNFCISARVSHLVCQAVGARFNILGPLLFNESKETCFGAGVLLKARHSLTVVNFPSTFDG